MHFALWKKAFREARWLLFGGATVMYAFHWMRVWLISQVPLDNFKYILSLLPSFTQKLSPVSWTELATTVGRIAAGYNEPLVVLIVTVWGISRGSDVISGEIGRGTMEVLLAQPVRRLAVLGSQAAVTLGGAAVLALAAWAGTFAGLHTVTLEDPVDAVAFLPAVLNLFSLCAFLAGVSTFASSFDRYRTRTIGLVGGLYVVATVLNIIGRVSEAWHWVLYATFFSAFQPTLIVVRTDLSWKFWSELPTGGHVLGGLGYDAVLLGLAALCYGLAAVIFCRRDLPAPL